MLLLELFSNLEQPPEQNQDVDDDNSRPMIGDLRKSKLTLRQLNKLRKLNDVRQVEFQEKLENVKNMYGSASAEI